MSFQWNKYLVLAQELAGKPVVGEVSQEAKLRSAISRAYYAAFHTAQHYILSQPDRPLISGQDSHIAVCQWFQTSRYRHEKHIGNGLDRLRQYRIWADYKAVFFGSVANIAEESLTVAGQVITSLHQLQQKQQR